jgi:hypothetical protein
MTCAAIKRPWSGVQIPPLLPATTDFIRQFRRSGIAKANETEFIGRTKSEAHSRGVQNPCSRAA